MDLVFKQVHERTRNVFTATVHHCENKDLCIVTITASNGVILYHNMRNELPYRAIESADARLEYYIESRNDLSVERFISKFNLKVSPELVRRWLNSRDGWHNQSDEDEKADLLKWLEAN